MRHLDINDTLYLYFVRPTMCGVTDVAAKFIIVLTTGSCVTLYVRPAEFMYRRHEDGVL